MFGFVVTPSLLVSFSILPSNNNDLSFPSSLDVGAHIDNYAHAWFRPAHLSVWPSPRARLLGLKNLPVLCSFKCIYAVYLFISLIHLSLLYSTVPCFTCIFIDTWTQSTHGTSP